MALDRSLQEALIESRQRFKDLVEIATDFAWETDASGQFVFVSPKGALGWTANELVGRAAAAFVADAAQSFVARAPVIEEPLLFRRADGGTATLSVSAVPVEDGAGIWRGARGVCRDVTAELKRERDLAAAQLRLQLFARILRVVRDEPDPTAAIDAAIAELARAVGAAGGAVLGGPAPGSMAPIAGWGEVLDEALLRQAAEKLGGDAATLWHRAGRRGAGRLARCRDAIEGAVLLWQPEENGDFAFSDRALIDDVADYVGLLIAQRAGLERVVAASRTDPLTGLSNRRAFFDQLDRALARLARDGGRTTGGALLYIDLDHFKLVNDHAGHAAGDTALKQLADILLRLSRVNDLAARLGGDEFVLWIDGIGRKGALERAAQLRDAYASFAQLTGDPRRPLALSIGIAVTRSGETSDAAQLVAAADRAMYAEKAAHKARLSA